MGSVIRSRLDLVLHLIDTTTGYTVNEAQVQFFTERTDLKFMPRGNGNFILINSGRENFLMQIAVKGYEKTTVEVNYEELEEIAPLKMVFLIPSERNPLSDDILYMRGNLQNLRSVSLVETNKVLAQTNAYDQKKKLLTLFERGYRLNDGGSSYAVLNKEAKTFEVFEIGERPSDNLVKLKAPLKEAFQRNSQVCRVVNGYVYPNGDYLIGVRGGTAKKPTIIRFEADEVTFMEVDFSEFSKLDTEE